IMLALSGELPMRLKRLHVVVAAAVVLFAPAFSIHAQTGTVPRDLKPLLAKPASEMRLVVTRYHADRQTLNANYAGPGGFNMPGGRGRGAGPAPTSATAPRPVPISAGRLARLKRFDLDWQAAVSRVPTAPLSAAAMSDVTSLQASIR